MHGMTCVVSVVDRVSVFMCSLSLGGLESHRLISPEERRIVAFHEAGK